MHRDLLIKSRTLGGSSDLTLLATIKPGFIDSLDSVTFKTRIKRVLATLHGARQTTYEYAAARLLSDSIERVGVILSVRVAVLEPEDKVLLVVTFDGNWESYIRVLWDKVGTLLDLIFCSTVDYITAYNHRFDEWTQWAARVQVESSFFYGPPDFTARDMLFHRRAERMHQRGLGSELNDVRAVAPTAEGAVRRVLNASAPLPVATVPPSPAPLPPPADDLPITRTTHAGRINFERIRGGLQSVSGLYRLTDLFRPKTTDGDVLRLASRDLLLEFVQLWAHVPQADKDKLALRFQRPLDWLFLKPMQQEPVNRPPVSLASAQPDKVPNAILADIQGGIVRSYGKVTHGALMLLAVRDLKSASALMTWLTANVTRGDELGDSSPHAPYCNVGFTVAGLRAMGLDDSTQALFPEEFRQGMAARAGLNGDVRNNHPRRWRLPVRLNGLNHPAPPPAATSTQAPDPQDPKTVELDTVHVVLQLRCLAAQGVSLDLSLTDRAHPLNGAAQAFLQANPGVTLLAAQEMLRRPYPGKPGLSKEHFGFADGIGQPAVEANAEIDGVVNPANRAHLGDVVLGHGNSGELTQDIHDPQLPLSSKVRLEWLTNGSFLVVRKYRQFADRLDTAVQKTAADMATALGGMAVDYTEIVYSKLMGRQREGAPLVSSNGINDFNYATDPQGKLCPLHSHVRLVHPRDAASGASRTPRIMRRGMSYGPEVPKAGAKGAAKTDDGADRGIVFMAYNANISEQFEAVQRWLTGGNSTGSTSSESCPIVGVPENGYPRFFRFEYIDQKTGQSHVFRVQLEAATPIFNEPSTLTRLEWGMYLFAPSICVLNKLQAVASSAAAVAATGTAPNLPWQVSKGRSLIASLQGLVFTQGHCAAAQAWKAVIEDPESIDRLDSAAVWAAIRQDFDGVLKTPYGTLVASREMVSDVFMDSAEQYSVSGQFERMTKSFGEISLGLDFGPRYTEESTEINQAILDLTQDDAGKDKVFNLAFGAATMVLNRISKASKDGASAVGATSFDVSFDVRELTDVVLATLSDAWFGLAGSPHLKSGSVDWDWTEGQPVLYPGHFTAMSRYMFQPNPGPAAIELGERYGKALRAAMNKFVADHRTAGTVPQVPAMLGGGNAPIAQATFNHPTQGLDNDWVARNMVGVLMGFNPTITGAVLNVVREWQRDGTFNTLRLAMLGKPANRATAWDVVYSAMASAAQMRPMPQIAWRTARKDHTLGEHGRCPVHVGVGDKVVMGLVSATQQSLADGQDDKRLMFGGVRENNPHPTHACPGYWAGLEAMLGTLTAILVRPETMLLGLAPLSFVLAGSVKAATGLANAPISPVVPMAPAQKV